MWDLIAKSGATHGQKKGWISVKLLQYMWSLEKMINRKFRVTFHFNLQFRSQKATIICLYKKKENKAFNNKFKPYTNKLQYYLMDNIKLWHKRFVSGKWPNGCLMSKLSKAKDV